VGGERARASAPAHFYSSHIRGSELGFRRTVASPLHWWSVARLRDHNEVTNSAGNDVTLMLARWDASLRKYEAAFALDTWHMAAPADDAAETVQLRDTLMDMMLVMLGAGKYRDTWLRLSGVRNWGDGHAVACFSQKLHVEFEFGFAGAFVLATQLRHSRHLYRMSDDFWSLLLSLRKLGRLTYESNVHTSTFDGRDTGSLRRSKSQIFRLIRDASNHTEASAA